MAVPVNTEVVSAALRDLENATRSFTAQPLFEFTKLVSGCEDFIALEASAITILSSRKFQRDEEKEFGAVRRFILQTISSPKRLATNSLTRSALVSHVCNERGGLNGVLVPADIAGFVVGVGEHKDVNAFALDWLEQATRVDQLTLISIILSSANDKSAHCVAAGKSKGEILDDSIVAFLTLAITNKKARLPILVHFDKIMTLYWNGNLLAGRKLVVKLAECWYEHGLTLGLIPQILTTIAIEESDSVLRGMTFDALSSAIFLKGLPVEQFSRVFSVTAAHLSERLLPSVHEKLLSCVQKMVELNPFRSSATVHQASYFKTQSEHSLHFSYVVASLIIPAVTRALPGVLISTASSTDAIKSLKGIPQPHRSAPANRLQHKILQHCVAILGDNDVSITSCTLLECYNSVVKAEPSAMSAAMNTLANIYTNRSSGTSILIELAHEIVNLEIKSRPALVCEPHEFDESFDSPLRLLLATLIHPLRTAEFVKAYNDMFDRSETEQHACSTHLNAVLVCLGSVQKMPHVGISSFLHSKFVENTLKHTEELIDVSRRSKELCIKKISTLQLLLELHSIIIPKKLNDEDYMSRIFGLGLFSPGSRDHFAFFEIPSLQRPLVKLADILFQDSQRTLFKSFASIFEEAFYDRSSDWDQQEDGAEMPQLKGRSRVSKVCGVIQALGVICDQNALSIKTRIQSQWKLKSDLIKSKVDAATIDQEGGDGSYLKDLMKQQSIEKEINEALDASMCHDGFLACYTIVLEELALDHQAPLQTRIAAISTLGIYCVCSPTLTTRLAPFFLEMGLKDISHPPELRCKCLRAWARLGPQCAADELAICRFICPLQLDESSRIISAETGKVFETKYFGGYHELGPISASVRITAMSVLYGMIVSDKVKGQECLCSLAESLIDPCDLVRQHSQSIFTDVFSRKAIKSNIVFEVLFSAIADQRRLEIATKLIDLARSLKLEAFMMELAGGISREVVQKKEVVPAAILAILPVTDVSLSAIHHALIRGTFRGASSNVLRMVRSHLNQEVLMAEKVMQPSLHAGKRPKHSKPTEEGNAPIGAARERAEKHRATTLMLDDLIRLECTDNSFKQMHFGEGFKGTCMIELKKNESADGKSARGIERMIGEATDLENGHMAQALQHFKKKRVKNILDV